MDGRVRFRFIYNQPCPQAGRDHPFGLGRKDAKPEQGNFQIPAGGFQKIPLHPPMYPHQPKLCQISVRFSSTKRLTLQQTYLPCKREMSTAVDREIQAFCVAHPPAEAINRYSFCIKNKEQALRSAPYCYIVSEIRFLQRRFCGRLLLLPLRQRQRHFCQVRSG